MSIRSKYRKLRVDIDIVRKGDQFFIDEPCWHFWRDAEYTIGEKVHGLMRRKVSQRK